MNDHLQTSASDSLSAEGRRRRDAMLGLLIGDMQTIHRRRRTRRHMAASAMMVVTVVGLAMLIQDFRGHASREADHVQLAQQSTSAATGASGGSGSRSIIEFVKTDESLVERLRSASVSKIDVLDDQSLLTALSDAGRPTGLIRAEGHAWLTSDVVDPIVPPTGGM